MSARTVGPNPRGPRPPLPCPACGAPMNRHAEKLVLPATPAETAACDPALGGVLEEQHLCPACGLVESVRVRA